MKKSDLLLIMAIISLVAISLVSHNENKKRQKNQSIDFTMKIEKMECGDSLLISDLTHPDIVKQVEKSLKEKNNEVWMGNVAYYYSGINHSKNPNYQKQDKFVYFLDKATNSQFELSIENRKVYYGTTDTKCLLVYVTCN